MKLIYGYQQDGKFLIATVQDDGVSESTEDTKHTIRAAPGEGEAYVELPRSECLKVSKHMQFGKKGDIRTVDLHGD